MNLPASLSRYGAVKVTTSSPGHLLVQLYDAMFRFLRGAAAALEAKERSKAGEQIGRTLAILEQLLFGLDREASPDLCAKLEPLYGFCMGQVTQANIRQDPKMLLEVVRILTPLRDAWAIAAAKVAADAAGAKAASIAAEAAP